MNIELSIDKADFIKQLGLKDGKDGESVDEAKIVKKLTKEVLKRIPEPDTMNQIGIVGGGSNPLVIQNNGARLSTYFLNLNFGAGLTASYSNGTILITANTSGSVLAATGTINDTNLDFTFISQPSVLIINGGTYQQTGGSITWTWMSATLTATLSTAVGNSGSIFGLI